MDDILFLGSELELISLRREGITTDNYNSSVYANLFITNREISLKSLFAIFNKAYSPGYSKFAKTKKALS